MIRVLGTTWPSSLVGWQSSHAVPRRPSTIQFGAILPLTGPGGLIGTQQMRGIQFAIDQANAKGGVRGNKIEVLFEDNQAKPDQSVLSFNKLVDLEHLPVIFTAYSGPIAGHGAAGDAQEGADGQCRRAGRQAGDRVALSDQHAARRSATRSRCCRNTWSARARPRPPSCSRTTPPASPAATTTWSISRRPAARIVAQEPTQFGQTDFRPALLKLADAKPQVMLVSITAAPLQMAQQYQQLGLNFTVAGHDVPAGSGH